MTYLKEKILQIGTLNEKFFKNLTSLVYNYINTLYYTNQISAYILAIISSMQKKLPSPRKTAITITSISLFLFCLTFVSKKHKQSENKKIEDFKKKLIKTVLNIHTNIPILLIISIISSICLVISFETLLLFYCHSVAIFVTIKPQITIFSVSAMSILKFLELMSFRPIYQRAKTKYFTNDDEVTEKSQIEYIRTPLFYINNTTGFLINGLSVTLTVLFSLQVKLTSSVSFLTLGFLGTLAMASSIIMSPQEKNLSTLKHSPTTLPSINIESAATETRQASINVSNFIKEWSLLCLGI